MNMYGERGREVGEGPQMEEFLYGWVGLGVRTW